MLILNDLHMIINNLRWYNQKFKVLVFPSYLNNCQSSCFHHHIFMAICHFFKQYHHKANLRDLIAAAAWPNSLTQIRLISPINQPVWPWNLMNDLEKHKAPLLYIKLCASNRSYSPEMLDSGKKWRFFVPRELEIWWMTLKNNRAPLLYYVKLCA